MKDAWALGADVPVSSDRRKHAVAGLLSLVAALSLAVASAVHAGAHTAAGAIAIATASLAFVALILLLLGEQGRRDLARDNRELRTLVTTDPLTALGNRRSFDEALDRAWRDTSRRGAPLSLLLADADHFKSFNDAYGHAEGDRALRAVAGVLAASTRRPSDGAFRIGGEEFAILLPDTDAAGAAVVAATIRAGVAALPTRHPGGVSGRFTLSIGIAQATPKHAEADRQVLFTAADRALYRAKADGRNRIRVTAVVSPKQPPDRAEQQAINGLEILLPDGKSLTISQTISVSTLQSVIGLLQEGQAAPTIAYGPAPSR